MKKQRIKLLALLMAASVAAGPVLAYAPQVQAAQVSAAEEEGENYIEHTQLSKKTDEHPCQVTFSTYVPDGFTESTYVVFKDESGTKYRASMISDNLYETRLYLAPGHYTVLEVGVYDNDDLTFELSTAGFTLTDSTDQASVSYTMNNMENIVQDENGHFVDMTEEIEEESSKALLYSTPFDNIRMNESYVLYYDIEHKGDGVGNLQVFGYASGDYDIVVRISKGGLIGEAEMEVSIDGGETFTEPVLIEESVESETLGLTFAFSSDEEETGDAQTFVEGDEYSFSTIEAFPATTSVSLDEAMLIITGHPANSHSFKIEVLSGGGLGESKISVTDDKGNLEYATYTIPENGELEIGDDLTLVFADLGGYVKGVEFSSKISGNTETVDYRPLFVLLGVVGAAVIGIFVFLFSKKEKQTDYHIKPYKWRRDDGDY